jgi:AraC-like DNA-binding protein
VRPSDRLELREQDVAVPGILVVGRYRHAYAHVGLTSHSHPGCIEVCYLARGRQRYRLGGHVYDLSGGDQFVALPDEDHDTAGEPQDKGVLYWLIVRIDPESAPLLFLDRARARAVKRELRAIPARQFPAHKDAGALLDDAIARLLGPPSRLRQLHVASLLTQYLLGTVAAGAAAQERTVSEAVRHSSRFVADHLGEPITVTRLAQVVGLSVPRLHARFRQEVGVPPGEFILRSKIERARTLLGETDQTVTDIAHALGFASAQYFATAFKRLTRTTPTSYRRSIRSDPADVRRHPMRSDDAPTDRPASSADVPW